MSHLQTLVEKLQDSDQALTRFRDLMAETPFDEVLASNIKSIEKRQNDLRDQLDRELNAKQNEFVRYRIVRDWSDAYPAKAVAASIAAFQELVTSVFDAVRTSPKRTYRPSAENEELSTFNFAGASAGSVIVSLTVPNDRLLTGETELDLTLALVERTLSARASDDLKILAEIVGISSITKAYNWAKASSSYGLDTEIMWGKNLLKMHDISISREDADLVKELIENKSEENETVFTVFGILVGFDGDTSYFHLKTPDEENDIKGNVASDLGRSWTTDRPYAARIRRTVQVKYATGEQLEKLTLIELTPTTALGSE